MDKVLTAAAMTLALSASAQAVSVRDCDGTTDSARNIVEPWEKSTRKIFNGQVRITHLDTGGEPVCCSSHLMVTYPAPEGEDPTGYGECKLVGSEESMGFLSIGYSSLKTEYDPKKGLLITFPYTTYNHEGDNHPSGSAKLRLNLKTGKLTVEQ